MEGYMVRRFIVSAAVCTFALAAFIGCDDKSPTAADNSAPTSAVGVYKQNNLAEMNTAFETSYDSVFVNLRSDDKYVTKFHSKKSDENTTDSGSYKYSSGAVTCVSVLPTAIEDTTIYNLKGNTLTGLFGDTYLKQ